MPNQVKSRGKKMYQCSTCDKSFSDSYYHKKTYPGHVVVRVHSDKMHWTQRPENKKRLKQLAFERAKKRKENVTNGNAATSNSNGIQLVNVQEATDRTEVQVGISFLFGRFDRELEDFSVNHSIPKALLASRMGELFQRKARGR